MPYRWEAGELQERESLESALRRIATEQVDRLIEEIRADDVEPHTSVHQLRKRCKKIRGLLRLVRPGFDDYSKENAFFRDMARDFSALRDAEAMTETLSAVVTRYGDELPDDAFGLVREWLVARRKALADNMDMHAALAKACETLVASKPRIAAWRVTGDELATVIGGLGKTYGRAREGMHSAAALPTPACFHEWRKRAKYYRYQLRLLTPAWPPVLNKYRKAARDVSDWLGDDHDLAVFREIMGEHAGDIGGPEEHPALLALFARRSAELRGTSFALGARLFAAEPAAHADRMGKIVAAWRENPRS